MHIRLGSFFRLTDTENGYLCPLLCPFFDNNTNFGPRWAELNVLYVFTTIKLVVLNCIYYCRKQLFHFDELK